MGARLVNSFECSKCLVVLPASLESLHADVLRHPLIFPLVELLLKSGISLPLYGPTTAPASYAWTIRTAYVAVPGPDGPAPGAAQPA